MRIEFDVGALPEEIERLSQVQTDAVCRKSLTEIYNRGKTPGWTPVATGELRMSLGMTMDEVGYTKEYAPHVEYGHRTRGGGYVPGRYYFRANVAAQESIFREDLQRLLRG